MQKNKFIEKAKLVHGDKYDYSLLLDEVDYKIKIDIICPHHGVFKTNPNNHLRGKGCFKCAVELRKKIFVMSKDEFIKRANEAHNNKYNYSKVVYVNNHNKVCIICPDHGEFWQTPSKHILRKHGCRKCGMKNKSQCQPMNTKIFIEKAKLVHGDKYDYSLVDYKKTHENVKIICPDHGVFEQLPSNHLRNDRGCPKCKANFSNVEKDFLEFIKNEYNKDIIVNDKNIIKPYELDIYLPDLKLAFEFNGLYWHSEKFLEKNYHLNKTNFCENKGIHLVQIYEDDWIYKQEIVKSRTINLLSKSKKIPARKCEVREVSFLDAKHFLEKNHIQGNCISKIRIGLYYKNNLVSLMTFGNLRKNLGYKSQEGFFELLRFCNLINHSVIGGANKLFISFLKRTKSKKIISYADRSWTYNNGKTLYDNLGFKFVAVTNPNYYYINKGVRENRFKFRKNILVQEDFDNNKTEHEIMSEKGFLRIYDSGSIKYEFENKS